MEAKDVSFHNTMHMAMSFYRATGCKGWGFPNLARILKTTIVPSVLEILPKSLGSKGHTP